jgi:Na+/melibiose symporter-like transporter
MRAVTMRSLRIGVATGFVALATLVTVAVPAGAQQLVDAGAKDNGSGGLAFVAFALMVFGIGFALFFMDRVRRRATDDDRRR